MTQHTPGPWAVRFCSNFPDQTTIQERDTTQGRILAVVDTNDEQDEANASLIAAAPELLAALWWIADHGDTGAGGRPAYHDMRDHARKAIAKAEGRP